MTGPTPPRTRARVALLATTAVAVVLLLPHGSRWSAAHPSYWGIAGFLVAVALLLRSARRGWDAGSANRRVVRLFLLGLPAIYVANTWRVGAPGPELGLQLVGLVVWAAFALRARSSDLALWFGCAAHALWDAAHYGRVESVPEWYAAACVAADLGLAGFVLLSVRSLRAPPLSSP